MNLRMWKRRRLTRDTFLFCFGVAGIIYETLAVHVDRPSLLFVFGACVGLPAFLHSDERGQPRPNPESDPPSPEPSPPTKTPRKRAPAKKTAPTRTTRKRD